MQKLFIKCLYSLIFLFSTKIIAVSDATFRQGRTLPFGKKKMVVIKLGIDALPLLSKEAARRALGISQDSFVVGTLAELHPIKGLSYAIDAMSPLPIPNLEYVILGEGEIRNELQKQITEKKLNDKVFLKGFVKDGAKYLKAFDIFLLPSLSEAFSYTLLEAGFAEMPVIATNVGGIPEVIENDVTGLLIRSKNPKEIANAIRLLYENKEKAVELAKNLHESVTKNFSIEKEIVGLEKIIAD